MTSVTVRSLLLTCLVVVAAGEVHFSNKNVDTGTSSYLDYFYNYILGFIRGKVNVRVQQFLMNTKHFPFVSQQLTKRKEKTDRWTVSSELRRNRTKADKKWLNAPAEQIIEDSENEYLRADYLFEDSDVVPVRHARDAVANTCGDGQIVQVRVNITVKWQLNDQEVAEYEISMPLAIKAYLQSYPLLLGLQLEVNHALITDQLIQITFDFQSKASYVIRQVAQGLYELQDSCPLLVGKIFCLSQMLLEDIDTKNLKPVECFLCEENQVCLLHGAPNRWTCWLKDPDFYPYLNNGSDLSLQGDAEDIVATMSVEGGIAYGDGIVDNITISVNGIISFHEKFTSSSPTRLPILDDGEGIRALLAVYWTDLDLSSRDSLGQVYYQYYRSSTDNVTTRTVFAKAFQDLASFAPRYSPFSATDVVVVTWSNVRAAFTNISTISDRVTFQCVLISNGSVTFASYRYGQGAMRFKPSYQRPVDVGWGSTNFDNARSNYYIFDRILGNTGFPGVWFMKIGEVPDSSRRCRNWVDQNLPLLSDISIMNQKIPACPCSEIAVRLSVFWIASTEEIGCYDIIPMFGTYGRRCCYRQDNSFGFENRLPAAGNLQRFNSFLSGELKNHDLQDKQPKRWCCYESNLCEVYYRTRPTRDCISRSTETGLFFGDPHITTLDKKNYTFNARGEFVLLQVRSFMGRNEFVNFTLQGRTCYVNGSQSNATVFCAIALQTTNSSRFMAQVSNTGQSVIIFVNGFDYSLQFQREKFQAAHGDIFVQKVNNTLQVSTTDDIGLTLTFHDLILDFTIELDTKFKNLTSGLVGNFNGDPDDDLIFPNGTRVTDTSEKGLFEYGLTWAVKDKSVFTYTNQMTTSNFSDPGSIPIFLKDANSADVAKGEEVCLDASDFSCIYDFVATKDAQFAGRTKETKVVYRKDEEIVSNKPPIFTGYPGATLRLTVNQPTYLQVEGVDTDDDAINFQFLETPDSRYFTSDNRSITRTTTSPLRSARSVGAGIQININITLDNTNPTSFALVIVDSKGLQSEVNKFELIVCTGCSRQGRCNFDKKRNFTSVYFSLATCECYPPWSGDDCERDKNGCAIRPCPSLTNCTDVPAADEKTTGKAFTCSPCPAGTKLSTGGGKCEDVNECAEDTNPCTNAVCINTFGSFRCNCSSGYRQRSNAVCVDIDECTEIKNQCPQICINTPGFYQCECEEGFSLAGIMDVECRKNDVDPCNNALQCSYGCQTTTEVPTCFCERGYKLSTDGVSCEDIDECQQPLCSQKCTNSLGSYLCSCLDGYLLSEDGQSCIPCTDNYYGPECKLRCECRGRATSCSNVKGCLCQPPWEGVSCENDINECRTYPNICPPAQLCVDTYGSYLCQCAPGYALTNGTCRDIDECRSPSQNRCSQRCINLEGSYSCACNVGYTPGLSRGECLDINECDIGTSGCGHLCDNNAGSFVCRCHLGYILTDDRRACVVDFEPCGDFHTNCSFGCDLVNGAPACYCPLGFQLGTDNFSCVDINECTTTTNLCTQNCTNTNGSYTCGCLPGYELLNDARTCTACDGDHWGNNCEKLCNCYTLHNLSCDTFSGCRCVDGWGGVYCQDDVDECSFKTPVCGSSQLCVNTPGSFQCTCTAGFSADSTGGCVDTDECTTNPCDNNCTNTYGSFYCYCPDGFINVGTECQDIDECSVPSLSLCDQQCRNTQGGYACECFAGFVLNTTTRRSCYESVKCSETKHCSQICAKVDEFESCLCRPGYVLDITDNSTCNDIDECAGAQYPCINGTCKNTPGNFLCTCSDGTKLADDKVTCLDCEFGHYGTNCTGVCSCDVVTATSCSKMDGSCVCSDGWTGPACTSDIDECATTTTLCGPDATCQNSPGSYRCVCNAGFFRTNGLCVGCDATHYGQDCLQTCLCTVNNTLDCVNATGDCVCRQGSQSKICDADVDECVNASVACPGLNVQCINLLFSYDCRCLSGYQRFPPKEDCLDINECLDPTVNTCIKPEVCSNTNGSFQCLCQDGYLRISGVCLAHVTYISVDITLVFSIEMSPGIYDSSTTEYLWFSQRVQNTLLEKGRSVVHGVLAEVTVSRFIRGSVVAASVLTINDLLTNNNTEGLVARLLWSYLASGELPFGNSSATIIKIWVNNATLTASSSLCQVMQVFVQCVDNEECQVEDDVPKCRAKTGLGTDAIVGLGVGIPLGVMAIIALVILVCYCRKGKETRQRERPLSMEGEMSTLGRVSTTPVSGPVDPVYFEPDYSDTESNPEEAYNRFIERTNEQIGAMAEDYQQPDDSPKKAGSTTFWKQMSSVLEPHKNLRIERAHLSTEEGVPSSRDRPEDKQRHKPRENLKRRQKTTAGVNITMRPQRRGSEGRPESLA